MKFDRLALLAVLNAFVAPLSIEKLSSTSNEVNVNGELQSNEISDSSLKAAANSCIFLAEHASDLKYSSSTYRKVCKQNIDENKYPHWTPVLVNNRLQWKTYVSNDNEAYNLIVKSDCDHILEGQVLHRYIGHGDLPEDQKKELCQLFDLAGNNRSIRIKQLLNGSSNMRFIDKDINIAKGKLFSSPTTHLSANELIKRENSTGFVTLLDDYVVKVTPDNFNRVVIDMDAVFSQFYVANKNLIDNKYPFLNKRFLQYATDALDLSHNRAKDIILAAGKSDK